MTGSADFLLLFTGGASVVLEVGRFLLAAAGCAVQCAVRI